MFLIFIDRTLPDSFVHANIGPEDSNVGRIILKLEKELQNAVPNLSLKINESTPVDLIDMAIETSLTASKPYFINHSIISKELGEDYGVSSCYNTLKVGGGSFTLVRLNLKELANTSKNKNDFFDCKLPEAAHHLCELINARAKFIVEESNFFESCFLAREGLIDINNFTSMAGIFGLYEAVEILSMGEKMGQSDYAHELSIKIISELRNHIKSIPGLYCNGYNGKIGLHSQTGIHTDVNVTAGIRFRPGEEPDLPKQIQIQAGLQKYFDTGVSDIYIFDDTAKDNIPGIRKIIMGALKNNMKIFTFHTDSSDLVRISGFLVKKSEVAKFKKGESVREDTTFLGSMVIDNNDITKRKVRSF
jgi:YjjI family glycine radical enzyme